MKNISCLLLMSLLLFSCKKENMSCPEGFTGDDCTEEIQPKSFVLKSLAITGWPQTDANGVAWDFGSNVDLYAKIIKAVNGSVIYTSPIHEDAQLGFTTGWQTSIEYLYDEILYIEVWDDDGDFSADDYVGFCLMPYWMVGEGFPRIQTITEDGITIIYEVEYKF